MLSRQRGTDRGRPLRWSCGWLSCGWLSCARCRGARASSGIKGARRGRRRPRPPPSALLIHLSLPPLFSLTLFVRSSPSFLTRKVSHSFCLPLAVPSYSHCRPTLSLRFCHRAALQENHILFTSIFFDPTRKLYEVPDNINNGNSKTFSELALKVSLACGSNMTPDQ